MRRCATPACSDPGSSTLAFVDPVVTVCPRPVRRCARRRTGDAPVTPAFVDSTLRVATLAAALALAGCSSLDNLVGDDKIDYRSSARKTAGLEVPPDLTQLQKESRYPTQTGPVSASTFQAGAAAAAPAPAAATVAAPATSESRLERIGNQRFVATSVPAERLWPQLQAFWQDRGFTLVVDDAAAGILETEWAENRAKLPQDIVRSTIGRVFDSLYSTGERDKFRTRLERTPNGSEIYISHRGMVEVYTNSSKDSTVWQPRPADTELEAELLQRLMVKLGTAAEQAKAAVASAAAVPGTAPGRARLLDGRPAATLQVDDGFDSAWRRVGLALDRSGFTVEDRDRGLGLYFVRLIDSSQAGPQEPGFFARLFNFGKKDSVQAPTIYRVAVKAEGSGTLVTVLDSTGGPENGPAGKRIAGLLLEELK